MSTTQPEIEESKPDQPVINTVSHTPPPLKPKQQAHFLSRSHLPPSLLLIALLLGVTNIYLLLINQPASYWLDSSNATGFVPIIRTIMVNSPWLFAGVGLAYLLLACLIIAILPRYLAMVIWTIFCFIHLRDTIRWASCGIRQIYYDASNGTICGILDFVLAIIGAGILGIILSNAWYGQGASVDTDGQTLSSTRQKLSLKAMLAAAAWVSLLTFALVRVTMMPNSGWLPIAAPNVPTPRVSGVIVYDINREKAVLFGGATAWTGEDWITENDTWEWNSTNWTLIVPATSPLPRISHAMAYDEARSVTVLFGGKNQHGPLNDTWEWDGVNWIQYFPAITPPARCCHHMYYDSDSGKVRVYGGYDGTSFYSDIWEWDGQQWHQLIFDSPNPVASGFGLTYDPDRQQLVALLNGFPSGIWILRNNHWSNPQLDPAPPNRSSFGMAYDRTLDKHILFGGLQEGEFFNDTWLFDEQWQEVDTTIVPEARWGQMVFYDENRGRVIMFGGFDGKLYLDDMWELVITEP